MNNDILTPAAIPRSFMMTYLLITINCFVYGLIQYAGGPTYENLLAFGAKENGLIAQGEVLRLFFPMFLHGGFLHLFFNMYGLYAVGRYLEALAGWRILIFVYLISGFIGNLFSFTFSDALSVGASGSLFGILLSLFVIEKYQERLSVELSLPARNSTLGSVIVINAVITFVIPNIDWANHLGGAVAGVLLGFAIIMRHAQNLRILNAARFWGYTKQVGRRPFYKHETFYFVALVILAIGLSLQVLNVDLAEKARGLGLKYVTQNQTVRRDNEYMKQFQKALSSEKSETNPEHLTQVAVRLHELGYAYAAQYIYQVLLVFHSHRIGDENFLSVTNEHLIREALQVAAAQKPLPEPIKKAFPLTDDYKSRTSEMLQTDCERPANMLSTLGFFELAGRLYECAYIISPTQLPLAAKTVEHYWLADRKDAFVRFLDLVRYLEENKIKTLKNSHPTIDPPAGHEQWAPSANDEKGAPI